MASKPSTPKDFRSAKTGQYVPESYARRNPDTTVGERRTPAPAPSPRKK